MEGGEGVGGGGEVGEGWGKMGGRMLLGCSFRAVIVVMERGVGLSVAVVVMRAVGGGGVEQGLVA